MKLIQTNFDYVADWRNGHGPKKFAGSYLGRKAASLATIKRFLAGNIRKYGASMRIISVQVGVSFESQWISK